MALSSKYDGTMHACPYDATIYGEEQSGARGRTRKGYELQREISFGR
ncbi:hypothetical protein [Halalkalibacter lacteus]